MKIFIDQNNILTESKKTSNEDLDPRAKFVEKIRKYIFNSKIFRNDFYNHSIPSTATNMSKYIEYTHTGNRYEIRFRDPGTSNKIMLNTERIDVLQKILNEINSEYNYSLYISNDKDQHIKNIGFIITANQHLTVLDNQNLKNLQEQFKFVIKFDREEKKDTWFKEGIKIQIVNYMIKTNCEHASTAICSSETFNDFKEYVRQLHKDEQNLRRGMKKKDFNNIYEFIEGCSYEGDKECFGMADIIKKYYTSCDCIYTLASGPASFVTNDESVGGYLKSFKDAITQTQKSKYVKQHPADLLMIGSKFKQSLPLLSELDKTYCAISLKEEEARLGKVSNYVLGLKCKYIADTEKNTIVEGTVKEIRDKYLFNDINNYISSNNLTIEAFEQMCNKYSVALPVLNGTHFYKVTCDNINNKEKIKDMKLNVDALCNLFFTAMISSYKEDNNQKLLFAELINESLQIGDYGYYLAKDTHTSLTRVDKTMKLDVSNINSFEIEFTGNKTNAAKKVTNITIVVRFNNAEMTDKDKDTKTLQLDIRQNKNDSHNSVLELK